MLLLLGNCQLSAMYAHPALRAPGSVFLRVPSTRFVWPAPPTGRHEAFVAEAALRGLQKNMDSRVLLVQPELASLRPEAVLVNLYNERPVLRSRDGGFFISISPNDLNKLRPEQAEWIRSEFTAEPEDHETYGERFAASLESLRGLYPRARIVVVGRLRPLPAFGPNPRSLLHCWDRDHEHVRKVVMEALREIPQAEYFCLERAAARFCLGAGKSFDEVAPFHRYLKEHAPGGEGWAVRDIEHFTAGFARFAAQDICGMLDGRARAPLRGDEDLWLKRHYVAPEMGAQALRDCLGSGDVHAAAAGLSSCIARGRPCTGLLLECAGRMPAQQNLLHMMHGYARRFPGTELLAWCRGHRVRAAQDLRHREDGYLEHYLERIAELEASLLRPEGSVRETAA